MTSIGWGPAPALVQALCLAQILGEGSAVSPPSLSLKASHFECLDTHDAYAPAIGNYSTETGFDHSPFWSGPGCFWLYHHSDCCFATGTFDY